MNLIKKIFLTLVLFILTACLFESKKPYEMTNEEKIQFYTKAIHKIETKDFSSQKDRLANAYYQRGIAFRQKALFEKKPEFENYGNQDVSRALELGYKESSMDKPALVYQDEELKKPDNPHISQPDNSRKYQAIAGLASFLSLFGGPKPPQNKGE